MGTVFVDVGRSLDGFVAGPNGRPGNPLGDGGTRIHEWVFSLAVFNERIGAAAASGTRTTRSSGPSSTGPAPT